ncbi:MAG: monovalent cation/H+ antiporter complex subunit F [Anaplasma sp.]
MEVSLLIFSIFALLLCMLTMLFRVVTAGTVGDRVLAANVFNACGVALIMTLGVLRGTQSFFIDVVLVYACVGLASAMGFVKFFTNGWGDRE